jgi:hypothetical protein
MTVAITPRIDKDALIAEIPIVDGATHIAAEVEMVAVAVAVATTVVVVEVVTMEGGEMDRNKNIGNSKIKNNL